ncbi:hypothetical protein [Shimia abyssi]|uniref:Uncharacterized protein n=1 Tax=Shimia abyssi TaxID=1662395 RepID=A0A2P8FHM4_9RHOB|nr:hypothetical protein [Shimia abyssi]PSL21195.1 hypothetical protein CLV88_102315 [Shimia abyssi]
MRTATLILSLMATPVLADCPTIKNMSAGIRLTDMDGGAETYRTQSDLFVKGDYKDDVGTGSEFLLLKGIYVVESFDLDYGKRVLGSRVTHAYPLKPAEAPVPASGGRWDTEVMTLDGADVINQRESYIFGPLTQITIGGCSYDMHTIFAIYHDEDGYEEKLHYLPELGFAYLAETKSKDHSAETYTYVRIETLP